MHSALKLRALAGVVLIAAAVFLAYLPAINGGALLDDDLLLTENPLIKAADGLYSFWCTNKAQDYWPVSNTTLWCEWRLWGMKTTGYHVTNLILHIAGVLLLWAILRKLSIPGSFLAAMIFAVHPVNVESVAWISQRKGLLAMLFFLLSILCYLRQFSARCSDKVQRSADPAPGVCGLLIGRWYWLSLLAFVLAMLSKGSVAILPVLLLWIVWWLRPLTKWELVRIAPFFLVAVALTVVNLWFQTHGTGRLIRTATFAERLLGAGGVVWFYLYKVLLPLNLIFVYPQWHIEPGNLLWWLPLLAALVVTAILWWYRRIWSQPFLFAWGFFCVSLLPVLGFMDVGFMKHSLVADHYQHIALAGVIALVGAGWGLWQQHAQAMPRAAATVVAVVVVAALAFLSWQQSGLYRDALTLYQDTLGKNPDSWLIHNNLGVALGKLGRSLEAIEHCEQALRLKPDYPDAHNNLANAFVQVGRVPEAIEHYQQAIRLEPKDAEVYNNLGLLLTNIDRPREAIECLQQALRLKQNYPEAHVNLGIALGKVGRLSEAIEHFRQALELNPNYPEAYNNLGTALVMIGRPQEAIESYRQALHLKPNYPKAHSNLGNVLFQTGRSEEAIEHYQQALRIQPDYIEAYSKLALVYMQTNRPDEAKATAQKALNIARSIGQTALAQQIEEWLNSSSSNPSGLPSTPPPPEPAPTPP